MPMTTDRQIAVTWTLRHAALVVLYMLATVMMQLSGVHCVKPKLRSPYIRDYDIVDYDHVTLRDHHVTKRSAHVTLRDHNVTKRSTVLKFQFEAFDRSFTAILRQDTGHIYPDVTVETSSGIHKTTPPVLYSGRVQEDGSSIHGMLRKEGHFEGKIVSENETYYIESASHHFDDDTDFHTVIYRQSDVVFNSSESFCAHLQLFKKQKSLIYDVDEEISGSKYDTLNENDKHSDTSFPSHVTLVRNKREVVPNKRVCELYMQADHLFYQKYGSDTDTVIEKLSQHVQAVNSIFQSIDFDGIDGADNLAFIIKKIKVWDDPTVTDYKYDGNFAVDYFLDLHSNDNYDGFCLSYLFTNRDFSDGVLGLAWVGVTSSSSGGGVCETYRTYQDEGKSLNTGIVTMMNYGSDVPSSVSHVTFAHEIGHNWGSEHDPENDAGCTPGNPTGNYVMYARATSGDKENNAKLSSCSINQIQPVLLAKARGTDGCFVEYTGAVCGNRVVEDGEECDCGWEEDCVEGCCNPQVSDPSLPGVETPCTRKSTAVCSPSEGACCQDNCQYSDVSVICRQASDCLDEAYCSYPLCNETSVTCPGSSHIGNGTVCGDSDDLLVCYNGECSGSVCLAHGREPCYCQAPSGDDWKNEILCTLCCMDGNVCKPSYELEDIPDGDVLAGTPCNNFRGYCDVFKICREVDPEGPLSNLKKLFVSGEALNAVKEFFTERWYVGVAIGVGMILSIVLVVKFCSKSHKPPANDRVMRLDDPIAHSASHRRNQVSPDTYM